MATVPVGIGNVEMKNNHSNQSKSSVSLSQEPERFFWSVTNPKFRTAVVFSTIIGAYVSFHSLFDSLPAEASLFSQLLYLQLYGVWFIPMGLAILWDWGNATHDGKFVRALLFGILVAPNLLGVLFITFAMLLGFAFGWK